MTIASLTLLLLYLEKARGWRCGAYIGGMVFFLSITANFLSDCGHKVTRWLLDEES